MESRFKEQIRKGFEVWSSDGEKLGKVSALNPDSFVVAKGLFFAKDYVLSFEDVVEVRGDAVHLSRTRKEFGDRRNLWDELAGMASSEDHEYVGRVAGQLDAEPEEQPYAPKRSGVIPIRKTG